MNDLIALLDACVIYPAPLRDLLVELAWKGIYQGRWTEEIHAEWMRNLRDNRPDLNPGKLERTRRAMDRSVRGGLVTGYEDRTSDLTLPDPDDRHVLAAAIHCNAKVIITLNLRDFPDHALASFGIQAQHPDDFLAELFRDRPGLVLASVEEICRRLRNPPTTMAAHLLTLENQGLPRFVALLRDRLAPA